MGIDPRPARYPSTIKEKTGLNQVHDSGQYLQSTEAFCRSLLEIASGEIPGIKIQSAFFEQLGPAGLSLMQKLIRDARDRDLFVLLDVKRSDIGSTAAAYARAFLGPTGEEEEGTGLQPSVPPPFDPDAVTVNPYFGSDGLEPFINAAEENEKGLFVLVKTSNPGAKDLQDRISDNKPLYEHVASLLQSRNKALTNEDGYSRLGVVVGATQEEALHVLRKKLPSSLFLTPGIGTQGGEMQSLAGLVDDQGMGCLVPVARSLIYSFENQEDLDWKTAVKQKQTQLTQLLRNQVL